MSRREEQPLPIATVRPGAGAGAGGELGAIGMIVCPGRTLRGRSVPGWCRDLSADLDAVRDFGAGALLTLMPGDELAEYSAPAEEIERGVVARGMAWYHIPIIDMRAPKAEFEAEWARVGAELRAMLDAGRNVVIHCLGGLGRTGTIAARLLVEYGERPEVAIARVREARPGAIQTIEQEAYVLRCALLIDGASRGT